MLIRDAEVAGRRVDLRIEAGRIAAIGSDLATHRSEPTIEARGGTLIHGLHDHHIHLLSLAAALGSIACGPPAVDSREALAKAIATAKPGRSGWLRGAGYFESVAGDLERHALDVLCPTRPLRIQHRSGSMWLLNSRAIERLGLDRDDAPGGIERDARGRSTGRLFRMDDWLRARLPSVSAPDLSQAGSLLARHGVTGVTDATPSNGLPEVALFRAAQRSGALPQRLRLMGGPSLGAAHADDQLSIDAHKILLDEPTLPEIDTLVAVIQAAHASDRSVALHTVTRTEIHFALAALEAAGAQPGDRLEHASVAPAESLEQVRQLGVTIVTQPHFVAERGDAYLAEVDPRDQPHLYRVKAWIDAGVQIACGTDAPFGSPDPWAAMRAAIDRRTHAGATLGAEERVSPETALALFEPRLKTHAPAIESLAMSPVLAVGLPADLCLLDAPWRSVREDLSSDRVVATFRAGERIGP
ncbi:MAG: hydrolase [Deltaproteobacteria bacterium]|nr:hydrolase [Deltaproteobacteria bacterium]